MALKELGVGAGHLFCLNYADGEVESNYKLIGEISKYIRKFKADIVCTHESTILYSATYDKLGYFVQHRDHRKTGEAVIDAVYPFSRDRSFFTEYYVEGLESHTVMDVLLTDEAVANFDFEIDEFLDKKKAALLAHKSQYDENSVQEVLDAWKFDGKYYEKFKYLKLLW